jgi:hypothetical protein
MARKGWLLVPAKLYARKAMAALAALAPIADNSACRKLPQTFAA